MNKIVDIVYDFFISSHDFNGITLTELAEKSAIPYLDAIEIIKELVANNTLSIQSGINPHIIGLGHYSVEQQIRLREEARENKIEIMDTSPVSGLGSIRIMSESHLLCIYPSEQYLRENRDISAFTNEPFVKELALGVPHLTPLFFELDVLMTYHNDPRYELILEDYSGSIYAIGENLKEKDQVFLQTFGLGVDENNNRVIVSYLRYLADLTPEHQVLWNTKRINSGCKIIAEYYENTILGEWTTSRSTFSAFVGEQDAVNRLTNAIYGKPLFKKTFEERGNRPKGFNYLFLPTLKNYDEFISVLDKMISENINTKFFDGKITLHTTENVQGRLIERRKGTLQLLEDWLRGIFIPHADFDVFERIFPVFKKIRNLRQSPAHKISKDEYDPKYIECQRTLMSEVCQAMGLLRNIFQTHRDAKDIQLPEWLDNCSIKQF